MLWGYQAVDAQYDEATRLRSRWADQVPGHEYTPLLLIIANERLHEPYADEADLNRLPPSRAKHALGRVPLLVRIQYMNQCHVLNGAAALALVRFAAERHLRWTIGGRTVCSIGWEWGDCPDGVSLVINQAGTNRVKHQAHAHQVATVTCTGDEGEGSPSSDFVLDLSAAQFGSEAALRSCPGLVAPAKGCAHSSTLAQRAAAGIAPGLFAARSDAAAAALLPRCRVARGQEAIEAALRETNDAGFASRPGFPLCAHLMPSPCFVTQRDGGTPLPDDDLVEGECLEAFRKFLHVLRAHCG